MEFTADQVWGLAVRADLLNNGYLKDSTWKEVDGAMVKDRDANKVLVKQWLRENVQPTEEEMARGREYRSFFNTYTLKALMGGLSDFDQQALRIAQKDTFGGRDMLEFAVVSCLPSTARREQTRNEFKREVFASEQLVGNIGEQVQGDIEVVSCRYNHNYNKHKVVARMGEAFVDFWISRELRTGDHGRIKGKIKSVRGDKTTQLNFVKFMRG